MLPDCTDMCIMNAVGEIVVSFLWYLGEGALREILNGNPIKL